ncbi:MAG: biliverdin-producing heme oxygenase [Pseudomonadota bacterium]|nr:biliverdin-producing heme oxygenase [Pseudomonadota bacterium]
MRNLFTALKQDTHANHAILENTFPFSMYHKDSEFNHETYLAILNIMRVFHQTTAETVKQAALQTPSLSRIASMLNSEIVLLALNNDTHAKLEPTTRIKNKDEPVLNAQAIAQLIPCSNSTTSQAIAAIYVWLGSSMGANIIVRRLEAMTLDIPTEYYQAMAGCAKAWVSFKQEVETLLPELGLDNESFVKNAVQDANAWFEFLISLGKRTAPNDTPYHEANV